MKFFVRFLLQITILTLILIDIKYPQTNASGNPEIYSPEFSSSSFGYLTNTIKFNRLGNDYQFIQKGIMFTKNYNISNIGDPIPLPDGNSQIRFFLDGAYRIGFALGNVTTETLLPDFNSLSRKYYTGTIDAFSLDIGAEYTYIFSDGYAISPKISLSLVNVGGSVSILDKGVFKENTFGNIILIPFVIRPSVFFDFGRAGLGISFYIHATNILSYLYAPKDLLAYSDRGVKFSDGTMKRFAFEIMFTY